MFTICYKLLLINLKCESSPADLRTLYCSDMGVCCYQVKDSNIINNNDSSRSINHNNPPPFTIRPLPSIIIHHPQQSIIIHHFQQSEIIHHLPQYTAFIINHHLHIRWSTIIHHLPFVGIQLVGSRWIITEDLPYFNPPPWRLSRPDTPSPNE